MKKLILVFGLVAFMSLGQDAYSQISKGDVIIDVSYGYSFSSYFGNELESSGITENEGFDIVGPISGRIEYLLSDKVGVGLDVVHKNFEAYNSEYSGGTLIGKDTYAVDLTFAMAKFNFYIVNEEPIALYFGVGIGTKFGTRSTIAEEYNPSYDISTSELSVLPISLRASLGFRYFFENNLGLNADIGIGAGSFVNGGVSYKF